ncbi:MAG: hypothetical protein EOP45_08245 [Sphingobacteriaceae bacterium]|nr:MAG: hypothetical protein EOP45_08245 [Sphingobacteriaceae bacterium]
MKTSGGITKAIGLLFLFGTLSSSCEKKEIEVPLSDICATTNPFVKEVKHEVGTVYYDSTQARYGIQVPTSMDSADMGLACNLPTDYQQSMKKVRFSGRYYERTAPQTGPVGYKHYELIVTSISPL